MPSLAFHPTCEPLPWTTVQKLIDDWADLIQSVFPDAVVQAFIPNRGGTATLTISLPVEAH